jgi:hypothetical protein
MTGKLQLSLIIPSALLRRHRRSAGLVRRPIAFEETLGHHPQKATRMLAVYAFFIDDGFDMRRARYGAAHSEEGLLVSQVAGDSEGHVSALQINLAPQRGCIEPTSMVESLMQINRALPLLAIYFRSATASQDGQASDFEFYP